MQTIYQVLETANEPAVIIGLFAASVILVAIDYYFPVDWPAHIAYIAFGVGMFLVMHLPLVACVATGVGTWIGLELMHKALFRHVLTNAVSDDCPSSVERNSDSSIETEA